MIDRRAAAGAALFAAPFVVAACVGDPGNADDDLADVRADVSSRLRGPALTEALPTAAGEIVPEVLPLLAEPLDADTAVRIALLNQRELAATFEELHIARAELVQAGLLRNPRLDASLRFFPDGTEIELGLVESILDVVWIPLRRNVAEAELAAAKRRVTRMVVHTTFDVRRAFADLVAARALVQVAEEAERAAVAARDVMRALHAAGNVTDPELTAEEIGLAHARFDLAAARAAESDAREPLNVLMGLWGTAVQWSVAATLGTDVPDLPALEHAEASAIAASLDLAENRSETEAAAQRAGLTSWESLFPPVEAGATAKRETDDSWGVGPALRLELPLFDRGHARTEAAAALVRERLARHVALAVEVRAAARRLRDRFVAARDRADFLRRSLAPLHTRLVHETLQNYNAMQIGVFDVLAARGRELAAQRDEVVARHGAWQARLDLEELLAGHLDRARVAATKE